MLLSETCFSIAGHLLKQFCKKYKQNLAIEQKNTLTTASESFYWPSWLQLRPHYLWFPKRPTFNQRRLSCPKADPSDAPSMSRSVFFSLSASITFPFHSSALWVRRRTREEGLFHPWTIEGDRWSRSRLDLAFSLSWPPSPTADDSSHAAFLSYVRAFHTLHTPQRRGD